MIESLSFKGFKSVFNKKAIRESFKNGIKITYWPNSKDERVEYIKPAKLIKSINSGMKWWCCGHVCHGEHCQICGVTQWSATDKDAAGVLAEILLQRTRSQSRADDYFCKADNYISMKANPKKGIIERAIHCATTRRREREWDEMSDISKARAYLDKLSDFANNAGEKAQKKADRMNRWANALQRNLK